MLPTAELSKLAQPAYVEPCHMTAQCVWALLQVGLDNADLRRLLLAWPRVIEYNYGEKLQQRLEFLRGLGLSPLDISRVCPFFANSNSVQMFLLWRTWRDVSNVPITLQDYVHGIVPCVGICLDLNLQCGLCRICSSMEASKCSGKLFAVSLASRWHRGIGRDQFPPSACPSLPRSALNNGKLCQPIHRQPGGVHF